jgi:hypothetical protein
LFYAKMQRHNFTKMQPKKKKAINPAIAREKRECSSCGGSGEYGHYKRRGNGKKLCSECVPASGRPRERSYKRPKDFKKIDICFFEDDY